MFPWQELLHFLPIELRSNAMFGAFIIGAAMWAVVQWTFYLVAFLRSSGVKAEPASNPDVRPARVVDIRTYRSAADDAGHCVKAGEGEEDCGSNFVMAVNEADERLLRPLDFPRKLLMGPGPSNASPRVLAAGALPMLGHLHPEFTKIMDDVKAGIQYVFQTKNRVTLAISGTGHAAMEAAVANLVEPDDVVLSAVNGIWGERFADMVTRAGGDARKIQKPYGEVFNLLEIEQGLKVHKPKVLFVTQGESSGTTAQPLEGLGPLCARYGALLVVDSVAAMGGVPLAMDEWGIDLLYSGSQKVLSVPPGTSLVSVSDKAWEKISSRKTPIRSFYFDFNWLSNYWGCDGQPRKYHHTGPISSIYGLREGLAIMAEEGLESSWVRHKKCAEMLWKGLQEMGLQLLVKDPTVRLPTVTGVLVPEGVDWKKVADYAMNKYRVEISGGLGSQAGKIWRIGVMGYNATPDSVRLVLRALREGLQEQGYSKAKL